MGFNLGSKEMYCNMLEKDIPVVGSKDRDAFVAREMQKCVEGVTIGGVHIWGSLYFHLNHYAIAHDNGEDAVVAERPWFRDNDWYFHEAYNTCKAEKSGLIIGSCRQFGKSDNMVSLALHELSTKHNAEVVGVFLSTEDKQTFNKKLKVAITHGSSMIIKPNIDTNFDKHHIRFGVKLKDNSEVLFSSLYTYLNNAGSNAEVVSGKTPTFFFMDEIGKGKASETYLHAVPALEGPKGLRCVPILCFTAGSLEKVKDAKQMFMNPSVYNFKDFGVDGKSHGLYMNGFHKQEFKERQGFDVFYKQSYGVSLKRSELTDMVFYASNKERAREVLEARYKAAEAAGVTVYNSVRMTNPIDMSDMFLGNTDNIFGHLSNEINSLILHLENKDSRPMAVEVFASNNVNRSYYKSSSKHIIDEFPVSRGNDMMKDAAVAIVDLPRTKGGGKLYVAGADPVNVNKTSNSNSLVSMYVMRKMTGDYEDPYSECIVAWYNGRKDMNHMYNTIKGLLDLYGAEDGKITLLHEAADDTMTQHFSTVLKEYYLENTYDISRAIIDKSSANNRKGLRPLKNFQEFYLSLILQYLEEELPDGRLGLWRIPDLYLLKQLKSFDGDLGPCDAIVAFGHCLMHLNKERRNYSYSYEGEADMPVVASRRGSWAVPKIADDDRVVRRSRI